MAPVNVYHLKFDFRLEFFHAKQRKAPLVYIESVDGQQRRALVLEVTVHRQFLRVRNKRLRLDEKLPFYYAPQEREFFQLWHSLELVFTLYDSQASDQKASGQQEFSQVQVTYSQKDMHLTETKMIGMSTKQVAKDLFKLRPNYFKMGSAFHVVNKDKPSYLSGACLRDVTLNGDCLFKSSADSGYTGLVKYGCAMAANPCTAVHVQTQLDLHLQVVRL